MYLRRCYRNKDGKRHGYWALVESYRSSRGPRQRVVAYLGEMDAAERLGIHQQAAGAAAVAQRGLFRDIEPQWVEVDLAVLGSGSSCVGKWDCSIFWNELSLRDEKRFPGR